MKRKKRKKYNLIFHKNRKFNYWFTQITKFHSMRVFDFVLSDLIVPSMLVNNSFKIRIKSTQWNINDINITPFIHVTIVLTIALR